MIKALLSYYYRDYYRSHKYITPIIFYITCIMATFSQRTTYIMSLYALSSIFLFFFSAWIAFGFIEIEDQTQQQLTILHGKNEKKYYLTKIIFIWIFILCFTVLTILYPIIGNVFKRSITFVDIVIAFVGHALTGLMGISIAVLFNSRLIKDRRPAVLNLLAILLISSLQIVIIKQYPFLKFMILFFPPVSFAADRMAFYDYVGLTNIGSLVLPFTGLLACSLILIFIFIRLMKSKRF